MSAARRAVQTCSIFFLDRAFGLCSDKSDGFDCGPVNRTTKSRQAPHHRRSPQEHTPNTLVPALSNKRVQAMSGSKRELIDTGTDKRYVKRDDAGRFKESDDQGRSLAADVRQHAKTEVKSGHGDQGDQKKK
jgi:hypothetical protein